jgi:hypothetical protein
MQVKRTVKLVTEQSIMYVHEALMRTQPLSVEPSPRPFFFNNKANRINTARAEIQAWKDSLFDHGRLRSIS